MAHVLNEVNQFDDVVVTDVRFEDEAALIRSMGGTIIHLSRPASEARGQGRPRQRGRVKILDGDYGIDNNGTLGDSSRTSVSLLTTLSDGVSTVAEKCRTRWTKRASMPRRRSLDQIGHYSWLARPEQSRSRCTVRRG